VFSPNGVMRGVVRLKDMTMLKMTRFQAYSIPYLNSKSAAYTSTGKFSKIN